MCGICGVLNLIPSSRIDKTVTQQMLEMMRHRGPDGLGIYVDDMITLGNARLSIIDLQTGDQPITNENQTIWIILNGEIFNFIELRQELELRGHVFTTKSDTEAILHAYEEFGVHCLEKLNGQFSIAIWDRSQQSLFLARDRLGITPLYYCLYENQLLFSSEIKGLLAFPGMKAVIDPDALQQVFTFWSVQSPRSIFKGINELTPGHYLIARDSTITVKPYWSLDFLKAGPLFTDAQYIEELESLIIDSIHLRLRSDVPVGVYLSGGIDSSIIAAYIHKYSSYPLETFSISFSDPGYDESQFQIEVANFFNSKHNVVFCDYADIGRIFPEVVWHAESPLLRTAPAPMYLLSKLVNAHDYRVVLTGEGADEILAGYDIFKEMAIRRFWARNPSSEIRPLLLRRLYSDIEGIFADQLEYMKAFFKTGLTDTDSPYYSHLLRWNTTGRLTRFINGKASTDYKPGARLPENYPHWSGLSKAQYLEIVSFLSTYLLSSQGDRMAMSNSVEARQPYLDYRLIEYCNRMPDRIKLNGLQEKWVLKQLGRRLLPESIWKKPKKPYRAPINQCFFSNSLDYVKELLSEKAIDETGYYNTKAVMALIQKASNTDKLGEVDSMAISGILSLQLLHQLFIKDFKLEPLQSKIIKYIEK